MKRIILEYIWYDVKQFIRSKIRLFTPSHSAALQLSMIPEWSYDGSSTGQAETGNSEVILRPVYMIKHPFYTDGFLILNENIMRDENGNETPVEGNSITQARKEFMKQTHRYYKDTDILVDPMFGLEQEFFFYDKNTLQPYAWSHDIKPDKQGKYYCGVNRCMPMERSIMDDFLQKCITIGIQLSGINQEVAPSQWEYQIGPVIGIEMAHQMTIAKYILFRLCEPHNVYPVFHPKPIANRKWNGSGCHVNMSTTRTREAFDEIPLILQSMKETHQQFMEHYSGEHNGERMSGDCETSSWDTFSYGVGSRDTSVRIPIQVRDAGCGYFEDRRPASNIDYYKTLSYYLPYLAMSHE